MSLHNQMSGSSEYAPAGWEADNMPDLILDSSVPGKYKSTVSNILSKHCGEIKTASEEIVHPVTSVSKKKLKELITKHNNKIFSFMAKPDRTPNMLGVAETIFRLYGYDLPTIKGGVGAGAGAGAGAGSVSRDLNLDVSVNETVANFDEGLKKLCEDGGGVSTFVKQMRWLFNQYRMIGEEVLRLETILYQKLDYLDKLNTRMPLISGLSQNDALPELVESFKKYVDIAFKEAQFEDTYLELVEAYKKWNICRQIVMLQSIMQNDVTEPQCSICLNEGVTTAIVPCGHTFCGNCSKKQNTTCYICRGTIRERIKLYFT